MKKIISCLLITVLVITGVLAFPLSDILSTGGAVSGQVFAAEASVVTVPTGLKAVKASDTSLKLTWKKVKGVSGYVVYQLNPGAKKYKKIKMLAGSGKITWTAKKLKSNKVYKFKIRAYKNVSGKKKYSAYSYVVSAVPYTLKAKKANVTALKDIYTSRYLGLKGVKKVDITMGTDKGKVVISKKLVWSSSNPSIVKVDKYGWIKAQGKPGKAKVYIRAHNGVTKTLNVTVADYAHPAQFTNLDEVKKWDKKAAAIINKYSKEMCDIAAVLETTKVNITFFWENGALQGVGREMNYLSIEDKLTILCRDEKMTISVYKGCTSFIVPGAPFPSEIYYNDFNGADDKKYGTIKIAPCWYFQDGDMGV